MKKVFLLAVCSLLVSIGFSQGLKVSKFKVYSYSQKGASDLEWSEPIYFEDSIIIDGGVITFRPQVFMLFVVDVTKPSIPLKTDNGGNKTYEYSCTSFGNNTQTECNIRFVQLVNNKWQVYINYPNGTMLFGVNPVE